MKVKFIGDLSKNDAEFLYKNCKGRSVLEFGVGGSTQIFSQCAECVDSLDTSIDWIKRTEDKIKKIGRININFHNYGKFKTDKLYDVIFNDGKSDLRNNFIDEYWKNLKVGGIAITHDGRREGNRNKCLKNSILDKSKHISKILICPEDTNFIVTQKCEEHIYENWNKRENKKSWEIGLNDKSIPSDYWTNDDYGIDV